MSVPLCKRFGRSWNHWFSIPILATWLAACSHLETTREVQKKTKKKEEKIGRRIKRHIRWWKRPSFGSFYHDKRSLDVDKPTTSHFLQSNFKITLSFYCKQRSQVIRKSLGSAHKRGEATRVTMIKRMGRASLLLKRDQVRTYQISSLAVWTVCSNSHRCREVAWAFRLDRRSNQWEENRVVSSSRRGWQDPSIARKQLSPRHWWRSMPLLWYG